MSAKKKQQRKKSKLPDGPYDLVRIAGDDDWWYYRNPRSLEIVHAGSIARLTLHQVRAWLAEVPDEIEWALEVEP